MSTTLSARRSATSKQKPSPLSHKATLAVFGGERAVKVKYRERWRAIRASDIARIAWLAARDKSTVFGAVLDVGKFEASFAAMAQTRFAAAMNSGTAAIHSAFVAVGVSPGDEVIVPSYTFFASAGPILQCGATPIFCDIDEKTLTADPDHVEQLITDKTRAICVVHAWGNPARLDRFVDIAKRRGIALIEDCSHAHGATFQGRPVGGWGDVGCFSLQGSKPVSGGEAGIAVTNNPLLFDRMISFGLFGRQPDLQTGTIDIEDLTLGIKYRPHLYSMVLARGALKRLGELNRRRRKNYDLLRNELQGCDAVELIGEYQDSVRGGMLEFILRHHPEHTGSWTTGAFANAIKAEGVPIAVDRWTPLHQKKLFSQPLPTGFGSVFSAGPTPAPPAMLPVTERVYGQLLTMPPFTKVSDAFLRQCARAICKVANAAPSISDFRTGT